MVIVTTEDGAPVRSRTAKPYDEGKYSTIRNWTRGAAIQKGEMGDIFTGKNVDNGQLFLIKSVARDQASSRQLAALENEEKVLKRLSKKKCPNIFRTVGSTTSESVAEIGGKPTMDLFLDFAMPRGNLTEIIQRAEKLTESVAKAYTYQILQALSCMHKMRIIHSDLRGINIIICEKGVKLAGFGLAKEIPLGPPNPQPNEHSSDTQAIIDVPPECQEDITALGLTVGEMVTGRRLKIDPSSPVDKVIRSLMQDFDLKKNMPDCMNFIQSCLWVPDNNETTTAFFQYWTADRLLRHPWMASVETFRPSDLTSDEDSVLVGPPMAMLTAPASPPVISLKKCAGKCKACCRKMCCQLEDVDVVIAPQHQPHHQPQHENASDPTHPSHPYHPSHTKGEIVKRILSME